MATFKPVVFTTKNHIKSDGTTNLKIRVYHNKRSQYIPTPYYIEPGFMNPDGNISSFYPDADMLNYELGEIMQLHKKNFLQLGSSRTFKMSCSELKEILVSMSDIDKNIGQLLKLMPSFTLSMSAHLKKSLGEWVI